jgi:septal ring factor EnvC (AmiA/AmiB activator)
VTLRRLAFTFFFLALTCTGIAYADQQQALENLRKRISQMQQSMEKTSESRSEASDALRQSERAISVSNRKLAELSAQQQTANQHLTTLKSREADLQTRIRSQQRMLETLVVRQYHEGGHAYLDLLLNSRDPNETNRSLTYYQFIARDRAAWLQQLRDKLAELRQVRTEAQTQTNALKALRTEENQQKQQLQADQASRRSLLGKLSKQLRQQRHEISRLQRDENRLSQLVEKLTSMLQQPQSRSLLRNNELPDRQFDGKPFEQLRGKLVLPVRGDITNRFGSPRPESNLPWKGLFLRTSAGQPVKAIAAGRIVFADWLRGFGNLLIVDHGDGYMSLYGNNETLYKQVGDVLHGGDTIATVGNSGGNEDSGLYFELRHKSKPLDPLPWLASK